jgi:serine/threonine protein kinase
MPLTPGTKLGPYEVQSAVGAGGMGEVYKARDTRLERVVAIKVLPSHLSSNPELRSRFDREAKAGLQHPNICVLYDVGSQDGVDFLVMEYLEGETEVHPGANKPDFSPPKELLSLPTNIIDIALLPDDKRILALRPSGDSTSVPIDFVLNWQHLVR